ncbi:DNA repair protein SWI5 homolog [Tyto alba]|uniref:DNA repair protein SWI5 homolog n=1 Tax=Tyto alba TaxID=56313 RepID=UPI001C664217|nr:DNA repair protein SWI5 homolog [Tyto alba]
MFTFASQGQESCGKEAPSELVQEAALGLRVKAAALAQGVSPGAGHCPPRQLRPRALPGRWETVPRCPLARCAAGRAPASAGGGPASDAAPLCFARSFGGGRRGGFKSPVPSPRPCQPNGSNEEALRYEIEELKQKDLALDQEIAQFLSEGYSLEELEKHISLLHEYNDIKDAGQMLLGKLAVIRGVTTKQLYPEYDLELND